MQLLQYICNSFLMLSHEGNVTANFLKKIVNQNAKNLKFHLQSDNFFCRVTVLLYEIVTFCKAYSNIIFYVTFSNSNNA